MPGSAFFYIFYRRNPLISLIRDKIVLQLQLINARQRINDIVQEDAPFHH